MRVLRCFPDLPSHTQTVELDGSRYVLTLTWRARTEAWYASIETETGTPIITGVRLEPGCDVLRLADPALTPPGRLLVIDAKGCGQAATRSVVQLRLAGPANGVLAGGSVITDTLGQEWILAQTLVKIGGTVQFAEAVSAEYGAIEAESATVTVDPWGGVSVTNPGRAVPGVPRIPILQADLGVSALLVYVAEDEIPDLTPTTWAALTEYMEGARVLEDDMIYSCTTGGISGEVAPEWPTTTGEDVTDGSAGWECIGASDEPSSIVVV
uniref:Cyanophage baseplate Pam3 plug gp18 domain-containing protein n=1 Tax=viral metagenome TaxID=1070528 RepID=A0A6M3JAI0_9ZZZZ